MNNDVWAAFADEMVKIALNAKERKEKWRKFTALGAAMTPVVVGTGNLLVGGRRGFINNLTAGEKFSRWLPAKMVAGAIGGGVVPLLRRKIDISVARKARKRVSHEEELRKRREHYRLTHPVRR